MTPYYQDDAVTLYLGDCISVPSHFWSVPAVMVADPPYGIGWSRGRWENAHDPEAHNGIAGDSDTSVRDGALTLWGAQKPAIVFGSLKASYPSGWRRMLVFEKPTVGSGLFGNRLPWLSNWEPIFILGEWPDQTPTISGVVRTVEACASGYSGYTTRAGHPHAKPIDVMSRLIVACPLGVILDPFCGSGSTLVAAKRLGRKAIGIELNEAYCEIAAKRLSQGALPLEFVS